MIWRSKFLTISLSCALLLASGIANSATVSTTGTFSGFTHTTEYYFPGDSDAPSGLSVGRENISGLQQFDGSLGTLTGVTLTTNFNVSVGSTITVDDFDIHDFDQSHSASFDLLATDNGPAVVVSFQTGSSFASLAFAETPPGTQGASCTGIDFTGCTGSSSPSDDFAYSSRINIVGDTLSKIGAGNIIGTGPLTGLSIGVLHHEGSVFTVSNLFVEDDSLLGDTFGELHTLLNGDLEVTLTYEYAPVVPLPAAAWLFGSALLGLVAVKRRKA